jgi:ABC-2 type transport system permease protein
MNHMWALYAREVRRFQKLMLDTVFSPIVSMVLYLMVFGVVVGDRSLDGVNYLSFIYSGLLGMIFINSSFSNPGFALIISKNLGTIVDLQVTPIKPWKIGVAYALAALTRGLFTLIVATLLTAWFIPGFNVAHPFYLLPVLVLSGLMFAMLGVVFGMWARNFEALTFITTFVLQPMIFLAGVFYPISNLPRPWDFISAINPLHHVINLFHYVFFNYQDMDPGLSFMIVAGLTLVLFILMHFSVRHNIVKT